MGKQVALHGKYVSRCGRQAVLLNTADWPYRSIVAAVSVLAQRERDAEAAAQRAAQEAAAAAAAAAAAPAPAPAQPAPEVAQPAAPAPAQPAAPAPVQPAPAPAQPTVAASSNPVAVRAPQPSYPRSAYRSGVAGEVTVEISIAANGSVSDVRVIRSQPRGTFDREVINTVREWQFEPMDGPATLTRTFSFRP